MAITTYDPSKVNLIVGTIPMHDFAAGTMIEIEMSEDRWKIDNHCNGYTNWVKNTNETGRIKLFIQQGSPVNSILSTAILAEKFTGKTAFPILISDIANFGTTIAFTNAARLQSTPRIIIGTDSQVVEWTFVCNKLEYYPGSLI